MAKPIIFDYKNEKIIKSTSLQLEKDLQNIIEKNMEKIFNIRFLKSEYAFSDMDNADGRIDSLGLDENNCPVVIEYKLNNNQSIINQTLFYIDYLQKHKDSFKLLVTNIFGKEIADQIQWNIRGICIAKDFYKWDKSLLSNLSRDVSLIKYYVYENGIIAFEEINRINTNKISTNDKTTSSGNNDYSSIYCKLNDDRKWLVDEVSKRINEIAEDIEEKTMKVYKAFARNFNFVCLVITREELKLFLHLDYDDSMQQFKNIRDVSKIGHLGTGNIEIRIKNIEDLDQIFHLIIKAYELN